MGKKKKHKAKAKPKTKSNKPPTFVSESFLIECRGKAEGAMFHLCPTLEKAKAFVEEYVAEDTYCRGSIRCFNVHGVEYAAHYFGSRTKIEFCWSGEKVKE